MKDIIKIVFVVCTILVSTKFFSVQFLGDLFSVKIPAIYMLGLISFSMLYFFRKSKGFIFPIQLITLAMLFSIIMAYLNWGQSIMDTLIRTTPFLVYPFFFYLISIRFSVEILEKIIIIFGFLYLGLYAFQFMNPSTVYFGFPFDNPLGEYDERRGIIRIIFPGAGIFYLAVFISICKLTTKNENKFTNIFFTIGGIVIPVLQVVRQIIAINTILYFYHFAVNLSLFKKLIISVTVCSIIFYILNLDLSVFQGIKDVTQANSKEGSKNIRVITGTYYLFEFSDNVFTKVFGNGVPHFKSFYGQITTKLEEKGIWMEDVGIIAMYSQFGIFAIISWLIIWYKSFTVQIPKEYYYVKYYLWLLLLTSFTSGSLYNVHYIISTVIVIYIYHSITTKSRKTKITLLLELLKKKNISINDLIDEEEKIEVQKF